MALVSPGQVSEIKNSVDILDIVSESVVLKKTGKNFQGLCPFHAEKTPSFTVSPAKQIYYCFGCGEGGDVLKFLMKKEGLTFPEALKALSKRCGIELPSPELSPAQQQRANEREKLLAVNRLARDFFVKTLFTQTGQQARDYLKRRGITRETIDTFQIGYAPEGWDRLGRYLQDRHVPAQLGAISGLLKPGKRHPGYYDSFRNRIIFPILDSGKRIIGFGGRVMDDSMPKYLNSPETPLYNKRRSLYGIQTARSESRARQSVFVVEGYFDMLALHQHGIRNSVATLGTALTTEHVQILKGFIGTTGHVFLVFDSDAAGIKAAERSIEIFTQGFVDARILVLPQGHDPDSFLFEFGQEAFVKKAAGALGIIPFLIESAISRHGLTIDGKIRIVTDLKGPLAAVEDKIARSLHIRNLADRIGIEESALMERVRQSHDEIRFRGNPRQPIAGSFSTGPVTKKRMPGKRNRLERQIIAMMLQFPDILTEIRNRNVLPLIEDTTLQQIGQSILAQMELTDTDIYRAVDIIAAIDDGNARNLAAALAIGEEPWDYAGCMKLIKQFEGSRKRDDNKLTHRIRAADKAGDHELLIQLLKEKQATSRKQKP